MNKAWPTILLSCSLLTASPSLRAQDTPTPGPKPAPEVQKLAYFFGTWINEAEVKPNPFLPAGRYTWTDKCDWFPGGFHLVCYSAGKSPMGLTYGLAIHAYNPEEKLYTWRGIDNSGFSVASKGRVDGNQWTFTNEQEKGGKTFRGRYSIVTSEKTYAFKYETSPDGRNWTLVMEGKAKRPEKKFRPRPFTR